MRLFILVMVFFLSANASLAQDCNGDGVVNADDLVCVATIEERDAVLSELNTLPGDLDGNTPLFQHKALDAFLTFRIKDPDLAATILVAAVVTILVH